MNISHAFLCEAAFLMLRVGLLRGVYTEATPVRMAVWLTPALSSDCPPPS
jgi:hypothetical protein